MGAYGHGFPTEEGRRIRKGYYPATRMDCYAFKKLYTDESSIPLKVCMTPVLIIDTPISVCFDTLFLPTKFIEKRRQRQRDLEPAGGAYVAPEAGAPSAHP